MDIVDLKQLMERVLDHFVPPIPSIIRRKRTLVTLFAFRRFGRVCFTISSFRFRMIVVQRIWHGDHKPVEINRHYYQLSKVVGQSRLGHLKYDGVHV